MRDQLLTLDQVTERLAAIEPLAEQTYQVSNQLDFEVGENWASVGEDDPTDAYLVTPGGTRYQMTKKALLEAGAHPGIPRGYQQRLAPNLLRDQLRWWYQSGLGAEHEFKVLSQEREGQDPLALAFARGTVTPYSNVAFLEAIVAGIREKYGPLTEILADYKFNNDLERTNIRLIIPESERAITGTRVEGADTWAAGVDFTNSLVGLSHPGTSLDGYLFRYWCTNGMTDTLLGAGKLRRRSVDTPGDAYEWAKRSVDSILGHLDGAFDNIQALTQVPVGDDVTLVLGDLFNQHGIPVSERNKIIAAMANLGGDITLYDVQQAITQAANEDGLSARTVDRLLRLGGFTAHAAHERCHGQFEGGCRRLVPEGWNVPASIEVAAHAANAEQAGGPQPSE
jgi:hypothetical protein